MSDEHPMHLDLADAAWQRRHPQPTTPSSEEELRQAAHRRQAWLEGYRQALADGERFDTWIVVPLFGLKPLPTGLSRQAHIAAARMRPIAPRTETVHMARRVSLVQLPAPGDWLAINLNPVPSYVTSPEEREAFRAASLPYYGEYRVVGVCHFAEVDQYLIRTEDQKVDDPERATLQWKAWGFERIPGHSDSAIVTDLLGRHRDRAPEEGDQG